MIAHDTEVFHAQTVTHWQAQQRKTETLTSQTAEAVIKTWVFHYIKLPLKK